MRKQGIDCSPSTFASIRSRVFSGWCKLACHRWPTMAAEQREAAAVFSAWTMVPGSGSISLNVVAVVVIIVMATLVAFALIPSVQWLIRFFRLVSGMRRVPPLPGRGRYTLPLEMMSAMRRSRANHRRRAQVVVADAAADDALTAPAGDGALTAPGSRRSSNNTGENSSSTSSNRNPTDHHSQLPRARGLGQLAEVPLRRHSTLPKMKVYPRMFFKLMDGLMAECHGSTQPVFGFFFGPLAFVIAVTPEACEAILSSSRNLGKGFVHHFLKPWLGNGLLSNPGLGSWRIHRKLLTPALHFRVLEDHRSAMNRCTMRLLDKLYQVIIDSNHSIESNGSCSNNHNTENDNHNSTASNSDLSNNNDNNNNSSSNNLSSTSNSIDILPLLRMTTFSVLFESALGIQLDESDPEHLGFLNDCDELADLILARIMTLYHWPDRLYELSGSYKQMRAVADRISDYVYKVIDSQIATFMKADVSGCKDAKISDQSFMSILLDMHRNGSLTRQEIRDHAATFIVGGFDTTATSTAFTLHLLGNSPDVLQRLQHEVDEALLDEKTITKELVSQMPYLDAVCKESLRLYPPLPLIARDITQSIQVGDIEIPAGPVALIHIYSLHRNPNVWERPNEFVPERFLDPAKRRHPFAFIPFSAGPRNCIGQKYAMQEDKIILAQIVRNFNIISCHKSEDLRLSMELIMRPLNGLHVQLQVRT